MPPDFGPTSHSYFSQRLQLRYVDWGNRKAPPLILLHGGRDHSRSWDWVARELRSDWHIIAPDLRGHGDSAWSRDGHYSGMAYLYDLAQLIHQLDVAPVTIVAHSLGGSIAMRYAGFYPDKVKALVSIEGMGPNPEQAKAFEEKPIAQHWRNWVEGRRASAGRIPKRYPSLQDACNRMKEANNFLSDDQAEHLTRHGVIQNEDGSFSWKFDPYLHNWPPPDLSWQQMQEIWREIACPLMLCYGEDSWATNPAGDERISFLAGTDPVVKTYSDAGHWLHHDQLQDFLADLRLFLSETAKEKMHQSPMNPISKD